jgi:hypothetical protein
MLGVVFDDLSGLNGLLDLVAGEAASNALPRSVEGVSIPPLSYRAGDGSHLLVERCAHADEVLP